MRDEGERPRGGRHRAAYYRPTATRARRAERQLRGEGKELRRTGGAAAAAIAAAAAAATPATPAPPSRGTGASAAAAMAAAAAVAAAATTTPDEYAERLTAAAARNAAVGGAGGGRAHGLCARALGYCSLPCKRGGTRGRPGRVAAWVCGTHARRFPPRSWFHRRVWRDGRERGVRDSSIIATSPNARSRS